MQSTVVINHDYFEFNRILISYIFVILKKIPFLFNFGANEGRELKGGRKQLELKLKGIELNGSGWPGGQHVKI